MIKQILKKKLAAYEKDPEFESWYCYMENKWLQNADWEEKLIAVFGSVENALKEFEAYTNKLS